MSADRLLALAAIAIAAVGLGLALWVVVWMRRVRRAQSALLSGGPVADLVEFAVGMHASIRVSPSPERTSESTRGC